MVWAILTESQNAGMREISDRNSSDRVVAIVGGAMLDDSLRSALESRLRDYKDTNEKLFKVGGTLGNAVPKIDLAYQLYMFEKPQRNAMYGLSEIRNFFAHRLDMTFDEQSKKFKDAIANLTLHEGSQYYPYPTPFRKPPWSTKWPTVTPEGGEFELEPTDTIRGKFIVNLKMCLIYLFADQRMHKPHSNEPIVPPKP